MPALVGPVRKPDMLERFEDMWVAVVDGEVVAAEQTSHALAMKLFGMDHRKRDRAVVQYVRPASDSYIVGVGQLTDHAYPWREEESIIGGDPVLRPTVDVKLEANELSIKTKALVDTGAPRCVFPRGVGDLIGLEFPELPGHCDKKITLMGRTWPAQTADVTLHLQPFDDTWSAEIDFVHEEGLPFGLLGYEGFLNRWAVSFNGYHGYFVVSPVEEFHQRQSPELIDRMRQQWPGI